MTGEHRRVIGLGIACLDHLVLWEDTERPVEGNRALDFDVQGGGMAATALVAVARLGGQAELWGIIGSDWAGDAILAGLLREGVDTSQMHQVPGARGPIAVVSVDRRTGERHFSYWSGTLDSAEPVGSLERLDGAGCLLVDGTLRASATRAAAHARRLGVPVVADIGHISDNDRPLVALVDYAIASEHCARRLDSGGDLRRACELIRSLGPSHVAITLGSRGLVYLDGDRFAEMGAFRVDVVDTTGAGDVFHGAFCFATVLGLAFPESLRFASAAAALKCRRLGGRAGIPSRTELDQFLASYGGQMS